MGTVIFIGVMKVKGMPIDQYRMSIEARPLRVLYSKYSSTDANNPFQLVRPLGRVRKERRTSSEKANERLPKLSAGSSDSHTMRRYCVSEIKMPKHVDTGRSETVQGEAERSKDSPLPSVGRSKTRAFEHRYKIAAARSNGQESPTLKQSKEYKKKVIHLPLFRIDLKTYKGDSEVNRAVANTRENLRNLLEIHKPNIKPATIATANIKPASVIAANIKNYEFNAPPISSRNLDNNLSNGLIVPPSFASKSVLRSPRHEYLVKTPDIVSKEKCHFCALESEHFVRFADDCDANSVGSMGSNGNNINNELNYSEFRSADEFITDDEADDSLLSIAIRPDTALTLGSTMHDLDRVLESPGSDELRELSEVLRNTDTQPTWPSYDEIIKMRSRNQSRRQKATSRMSLSRPGTVQNGRTISRQKVYSVCSNHSHIIENSLKPILRYSSTQSNTVKPIIVPSHTCTECPMCNIYKREKDGTPCPPNSPIPPSQKERVPLFEPINKPRSGASDRTRQRKQEVMQITKINVSGDDGPKTVDSRNMFTYLKAK